METTASKRYSLKKMLDVYDFHSRLFINALDGIADADAQNRLNTKANHMAWLAGSLVQERFTLGGFVGIHLKQTSDALFSNHKGIQDGADYPGLDEFRSDWNKITPLLREAYSALTEEALSEPDPYEMPGGNYNLLDTIIFCTDRESYCIGQLGLWRRLLNYPAVKYD